MKPTPLRTIKAIPEHELKKNIYLHLMSPMELEDIHILSIYISRCYTFFRWSHKSFKIVTHEVYTLLT